MSSSFDVKTLSISIRYMFVGFINTFVGIGVMVIGAAMGLHYAIYTFLGYTIGFIVSFILNMFYTFNAKGKTISRFQAFLIVNLINLALIQLLQVVLIEWAKYPEYISVGIGIAIYFVIGFFANRRYVFHTNKPLTLWRSK